MTNQICPADRYCSMKQVFGGLGCTNCPDNVEQRQQICPADDVDDGDNICMCGNYMNAHSVWDGHLPVSMNEYYSDIVATEDHSSETKEQYDARIKAKIESRIARDIANLANDKKKAEEAAKERHWTDNIKPWPGAHGSYYMLKL